MNSNNDHKTFNRKEVAKILDKATKIQLKQDSLDEGLTHDELVELARDSGISEQAILDAIHQFEDPEIETIFDWIKGTSKIQTLEYVKGEISDTDWENTVREIRRVTGGIGKISKNGSTYEWEQRRRDIGYKHLSLTPENGRTHIQYVFNWRGIKSILSIFAIMIPFMFVIGMFKGAGSSDTTSILMAALASLGGLGITRVFLKLYFEKQKAQANKLVEAITKKLRNRQKPAIIIEEKSVRDKSPETLLNKERA